jgi:hypothetical protein
MRRAGGGAARKAASRLPSATECLAAGVLCFLAVALVLSSSRAGREGALDAILEEGVVVPELGGEALAAPFVDCSNEPPFVRGEHHRNQPTGLPSVAPERRCDLSQHTLVFLLGMPFTGTSAAEYLLKSSPNVTTLCSAETWQCEDSHIFKAMGWANADVMGSALSVQNWTTALTSVFPTFWDLRR